MPKLADRNPESAPGDWYIDTHCIDCAASREVAPGLVIHRHGKSVFGRQPANEEEEFAAWRAVLLCPTASVGTENHRAQPPGLFPQELAPGVYRCGYNARSSFGAHSYFLNATDAVLEIGTGLGYQAAILAKLVRKVYSVEIIEELARQAEQRLGRLGYRNIELKLGNGYCGWPEYAPFDKVIVTAAPDLIPPPLIQQLKPDGRMVIPAGLPEAQQLILVTKQRDGKLTITEILPVRFSTLEGGETSESGDS